MDFFDLDLHILGTLAWLGLAVIFGIIEGFTLGLTTIWFAAGAVVAGIAAWFDAPIYIQIIVFLIVSLLLLVFTRPLAKKNLKLGHSKDITEALIGRTALIISEIEPFKPGQAKVNGLEWRAVAEDIDMSIKTGAEVKIVKIEGVKLVVAPLEENLKESVEEEREGN